MCLLILCFLSSFQAAIYDAKLLAKEQNMVVVVANYRVGVMGGFASKAFAEEHPGKTIGRFKGLSIIQNGCLS